MCRSRKEEEGELEKRLGVCSGYRVGAATWERPRRVIWRASQLWDVPTAVIGSWVAMACDLFPSSLLFKLDCVGLVCSTCSAPANYYRKPKNKRLLKAPVIYDVIICRATQVPNVGRNKSKTD